jgi:glycerol uptake facilitator-like aquaporin
MSLLRRAVAEALGTALLLAAVVGSGIMGERLAQGNGALALLANSIATGTALVALILTFGPLSGAQFNPAVSLGLAVRGLFPWRDVPVYALAQITGAILGVWATHLMFDLPMLQLATKVRAGPAQWWSEYVASFGLLLVIGAGLKARPDALPYAVAAYITAAYWFTASTAFANPAVTLARAFTDTFAGIRPACAGGFVVAQCTGALTAVCIVQWLTAAEPTSIRSSMSSDVSLETERQNIH